MLFPHNDELHNIQVFFPSSINDSNRLKLFLRDVLINLKEGYLDSNNVRAEIRFNNLNSFKKGSCFNRSILIQKKMLLDRVDFYPIFLIYSFQRKVTYFDLFSRGIATHQLIKLRINGKSYILDPGELSSRNLYSNIEDFSSNSPFKGADMIFIPHLNNRNGAFIYPTFIPDLY